MYSFTGMTGNLEPGLCSLSEASGGWVTNGSDNGELDGSEWKNVNSFGDPAAELTPTPKHLYNLSLLSHSLF